MARSVARCLLDPPLMNAHIIAVISAKGGFSVQLATATNPDRKRVSQDDGFSASVRSLRELTKTDLERVSDTILAQLNSSVSIIPDLARHLLEAGGKRLRPILTLSTARLLGYEGDHHIQLAAAVELIHGATLLHDDVVDSSDMRRGLRTANVVWGNKESVLVGDFLFSRAFELMVKAEDLRVLQILSHASGVIAEGEVLQLATQKNLDATFDMYLAVVESKTAALFAAAAQAGAVIAGADAKTEDALRRYGRDLGVAFQLIDDALDYTGAEAALGKSVGDDFREGKMTLPIVYSIDRATLEEKTFWKRVITDGVQEDGDLEKARDIMARNNALEDTKSCARRYAARALEDLSEAPQNEYTDALSMLAEQSVARAY